MCCPPSDRHNKPVPGPNWRIPRESVVPFRSDEPISIVRTVRSGMLIDPGIRDRGLVNDRSRARSWAIMAIVTRGVRAVFRTAGELFSSQSKERLDHETPFEFHPACRRLPPGRLFDPDSRVPLRTGENALMALAAECGDADGIRPRRNTLHHHNRSSRFRRIAPRASAGRVEFLAPRSDSRPPRPGSDAGRK